MTNCICCGMPIPDNRQVCKQCEERFTDNFSTTDYIQGYSRGYRAGAEVLFYTLIHKRGDFISKEDIKVAFNEIRQ